MSAELFPLFTKDEVRKLMDYGDIHDLVPTPGSRGSYTAVKCSTNTYLHPDLGHEFRVEIITGNTDDEHRAVQTGLRVAAKLVSDTGIPLEESEFAAIDESLPIVAEPVADAQNEADVVKIRFTLAHPQKYKSPYRVQFLIDPSQVGEAPRGPTIPNGLLNSENRKYEYPITANWITVWVDPIGQINETNRITASLSWPGNGLNQSRPDKWATEARITLQPNGDIKTSAIAFKVAVQVFGNASCIVSGTT